MREIKFRAWWINEHYLPEGRMYRVGGLSFTTPIDDEPEVAYEDKVTKVGLMRYDSDKIGWNKADECQLMQYTGLKDKNGREIYEGDIVTLNDNNWVCVYDAPQYWLSKDGSTENLEDTFYSDSGALYKVIGNIWENPELLT